MFKTRLLSGIVLVIAAIFLIVTGNEVLLFSTLLISCIGMFELFRVFKFEKSLLSVVPYIALILFYINLRIDGESLLEDIWNELGPYTNALSNDLRYRLQDYFGFDDSE
jgi:CDP-diglyceride synthetase